MGGGSHSTRILGTRLTLPQWTSEDSDVSGEIIYDGAPDGSRWLGLNRDTFGATAIIRQSEVLAVVENAEMLQEALQSAAATTAVWGDHG